MYINFQPDFRKNAYSPLVQDISSSMTPVDVRLILQSEARKVPIYAKQYQKALEEYNRNPTPENHRNLTIAYGLYARGRMAETRLDELSMYPALSRATNATTVPFVGLNEYARIWTGPLTEEDAGRFIEDFENAPPVYSPYLFQQELDSKQKEHRNLANKVIDAWTPHMEVVEDLARQQGRWQREKEIRESQQQLNQR